MARYRSNGFECPKCMGPAYTKWVGRANDRAIIVRKRRCTECSEITTTFEIAAPPELNPHSIAYWDEDVRYQERMRKRAMPKKSNRARPAPRPLPKAPRLLVNIKKTIPR